MRSHRGRRRIFSSMMHRLTACAAVLWLGLVSSGAAAAQARCERHSGSAFRDVHWKHSQASHPLVAQVLAGDRPIALESDTCARSPLQQLIVELWRVLRDGGLVLLGEVHDNPEHHLVRQDMLWPRLDRLVATQGVRPAAVFEHIRADQQGQIDRFYGRASRSHRLWRAPDLLRILDWANSGWPPAQHFYPVFDGALGAGMRIYPGGAARERIKALARGDAAGLTDEERGWLEAAEALPVSLVEALKAELAASHCGVVSADAFAGMSLAQRYRDAHLASALVQAAGAHGSAVLMTGNGHVRTDRGVPWYLRRAAPQRKVFAVMLLEVEEGKTDGRAYLARDADGRPAADYTLFTPRQPRPDPCERFRQRRQ
jgi:uncharacterized iron-regulated protein